MFIGDVKTRGEIAVEHRICCGWMKYKALQNVFEDKHIPIKLRLKLFDAAISSTVLYSLETCPLTKSLQDRLDVVKRTMLRRLVGWVSNTGDSWDVIGHRMKHRLQKRLEYHPIANWSETIHSRKVNLASGMSEAPYWTLTSFAWDPIACSSANFNFARRFRGRPATRWHNI